MVSPRELLARAWMECRSYRYALRRRFNQLLRNVPFLLVLLLVACAYLAWRPLVGAGPWYPALAGITLLAVFGLILLVLLRLRVNTLRVRDAVLNTTEKQLRGNLLFGVEDLGILENVDASLGAAVKGLGVKATAADCAQAQVDYKYGMHEISDYASYF